MGGGGWEGADWAYQSCSAMVYQRKLTFNSSEIRIRVTGTRGTLLSSIQYRRRRVLTLGWKVLAVWFCPSLIRGTGRPGRARRQPRLGGEGAPERGPSRAADAGRKDQVVPLVFALLQNRKGAEGRWAGPGLVGGAGPGRVSMRSARRLCARGGSLRGPRDAPLQMRVKPQEQ